MKELLLLFFISVLILLVGFSFGYDQVANSYEISEESKALSQPFGEDIDREFLRNLTNSEPAL